MAVLRIIGMEVCARTFNVYSPYKCVVVFLNWNNSSTCRKLQVSTSGYIVEDCPTPSILLLNGVTIIDFLFFTGLNYCCYTPCQVYLHQYMGLY